MFVANYCWINHMDNSCHTSSHDHITLQNIQCTNMFVAMANNCKVEQNDRPFWPQFLFAFNGGGACRKSCSEEVCVHLHIFVALSSPAVVASHGTSFAVNCPFSCLGCKVSLETSGYGAVQIRMGRFEVREGIWEVVNDHKWSWNFTTSISVPYIWQGPWAVMYVENWVPRGILGAREAVNHEL